MKIVVFASLTADTTANYIIRSLKRRFDFVHVFSDIASPLSDYLIDGCPDVVALCNKLSLSPDLFLFIEGGSMRIFPTGLEKLTCISAWYGIDTHMDYAKHLAISKVFDITFVAQKEFVVRLSSDGCKQVHWLPLAFEPQADNVSSDIRDLLISYVGSNNATMHRERHEMIASIKKKFQNTYFGKASPAEMSKIYSRSQMVFNRSVNNDVNMRYFEAMGEGAVLLTDKIINNGVDELFVEGQHYLVYRNRDHLIEIIEDLIGEPSRIQTVGKSARIHILAHHTYDHRIEGMVDVIKRSKKIAQPRQLHFLEIFIALGLVVEAINTFKTVLKSLKVGKFNKVLVSLVALALNFTSSLLNAIILIKGSIAKIRNQT